MREDALRTDNLITPCNSLLTKIGWSNDVDNTTRCRHRRSMRHIGALTGIGITLVAVSNGEPLAPGDYWDHPSPTPATVLLQRTKRSRPLRVRFV